MIPREEIPMVNGGSGSMTHPMPTLFISHGPPTLSLLETPAAMFLKGLGARLPRPEAILCISAHWEAWRPTLSGPAAPSTLHDFGGPPQLFDLHYPAPGNPGLAERVMGRLEENGMACGIDPERGLDHGAWVPLRLIYPDADIPVLQLSIQTDLGPDHHLALGRALAPLRREGVLIMGSGGATHNLPEIHGRGMTDPPVDYAGAFDDWLATCIGEGRTSELLNYKREGPSAERNHPWPAEHFLPLFVPLGAAGEGVPGRVLHRSFMYGLLSMAAYRWEG
jgi:4,5-DOPA dioxygenase extradiol